MTTPSRIDPPHWMTTPEAQAVMAALTAGGAEARFVGGCVRNGVLDLPVTDIDIATPEPPERVMALLETAGIKAVPTGIDHGTVTAVAGERPFEITTLRFDVKTFGRHAEVEFTDDWEADAARRDLTINALFCAPDGTLYDYVDGLADLRARRVRFVGDAAKRIEEDHLRLLRFFRFYAYYGAPPPDAAALEACRAWAGSLGKLSGERICKEIRLTLAASDPAGILALMVETGVLGEVLPEAKGVALLAALVPLERGEPAVAPDPVRRLAAVLREGGAGAASAEHVARRWHLSNADASRLAQLSGPTETVGRTDGMALARRRLYRLGPTLVGDLTLLAWAMSRAANGDDAARDDAFRGLFRLAGDWQPVDLPVRGADVTDLGVTAGPDVGALLTAVESWWEAGDFQAGRDEALAKLRELVAVPEDR